MKREAESLASLVRERLRYHEQRQRAEAAEVRVAELEAALRLIADGFWATHGFETGVTGCRQCARAALNRKEDLK